MIKRIYVLLIVVLVTASVVYAKEKTPKHGELYGLVVVIDPGHGGIDPGSNGLFCGKPVNEDENCYDVALRLERMAKAKGAVVFMTTYDKKQTKPLANKPADIIPPDYNEVFSLDSSIVRAGELTKRVSYANLIKRRYKNHKIVFISIHFDILPSDIEGARVIKSKGGGNAFGKVLAETFLKCNRADGKRCLVKSGDKAHGLRNMYVLGSKNRISNKVLIELGNFKNAKDIWRIRDYKVRENYAQLITRALIEMMKK